MRAIVLLMLLVGLLPAASYPMQWRIFRDLEGGTAFRFPYECRILDQYRGEIMRPGGSGAVRVSVDPKELAPGQDPQKLLKERLAQAQRRGDISLISMTREEVPSEIDAEDLGAILKYMASGTVTTVESWDYYQRVDERPQADPKWAFEGIRAMLGTGNAGCALLFVHGDRYNGLILRGPIDSGENRRILDSFEVLAPLSKSKYERAVARMKKKGKSYVASKTDLLTWRSAQWISKKKLLTADGKMVSATSKSKPVGWGDAWHVETPAYHITCTVSPARLHEFAGIMETLHDAFLGVYQPDSIPPYKMEIHIHDTVNEFASMAGAMGFGPVSTGQGGSLTGGFFVPAHLSIHTFDKPVKGFPTKVERVLAHEASHQFLHVTCNGSRHVPTWINEGLAVYFESGDYRPGRMKWLAPKERLSQLRQVYGQMGDGRTLWPLHQYLKHYGHIPAMNYAEVYLMTHFFIYSSPKGKELFKEYWMALKAGENGTEAFERIFLAAMIKAQGGQAKAMQVWASMLRNWLKKGKAG